MTPLRRLARHEGLTLEYEAPDGGIRTVPDATLEAILRGLGVDPDSAPEGPPAPDAMTVPAEARCFLPSSLRERPGWGVFCQLYELRSATNWGIGDFADLAALAEIVGRAGADFLGVNPLHALFLARPRHASPFSPSNRRFLNPLYVAPSRLGIDASATVAALRDADEIDYPAVARLKLAALRTAFDAAPPDSNFDRFAAEASEALRLHAIYETISAASDGWGWPGWPEAFQDHRSDEVRRWAEEHADEVRFHVWLQWVARRQLREAQDAALAAGMRIGLYLDLAVGEAPDGSSTWSGEAAALPGVTVGAPPDMFSQEGQNWGLAAPSPHILRDRRFAPFREMIRAQIRSAGALRIDHAMALWQLFLVPDHQPATSGTHLRFPFADMLRVLAEESREARAVVIGEDLGWVPDGFRPAMEEANILAYRIVVFEQDEHGFLAAERYPETALACLSTHDLPVLSAWWRGDDIDRRREHGLVSPTDTEAHRTHRARERVWMLRLVGLDADSDDVVEPPPGLLEAAHRFIASTPCLLAGVRLADLVGPVRPTNLPGVGEGPDGYPNWRPRSPTPLEALADHPTFQAVTAVMREHRPR